MAENTSCELLPVKETLKKMYANGFKTDTSNFSQRDRLRDLPTGTYYGTITGRRIYKTRDGSPGCALKIRLLCNDADSSFSRDMGEFEKFYNFSNEYRFHDIFDLYVSLGLTVVNEDGEQIPVSEPEHVVDASPVGRTVEVKVLEATNGDHFLGTVLSTNFIIPTATVSSGKNLFKDDTPKDDEEEPPF